MTREELRELIEEVGNLLADLGLSRLHVSALDSAVETRNPLATAAAYFEVLANQLSARSRATYLAAMGLLREHVRTEDGRPISNIVVVDEDRGVEYSLERAPDLAFAVESLRAIARDLRHDTLDGE